MLNLVEMNNELTDEDMAKVARYHLEILKGCIEQLTDRGYDCFIWSKSGNAIGWPDSLEVKKEVSL